MVLGLGFSRRTARWADTAKCSWWLPYIRRSELQQYAFNAISHTVTERSLHPLRKLKVQALIYSATSLSCPWKLCDKCNEKTPCTGMQRIKCCNVLVHNEPPLNQDVHTNFESLVLDSVWHSKEKDAERMYRSKQYLTPKLQSLPMSCTKKAKVHQSLKRWIASKPIHPKNCVRLSVQ